MSKKESALELAKLMDKGVRVKLAGGREGTPLYCNAVRQHFSPFTSRCPRQISATAMPEMPAAWPAVSGVLKGYDQLLNLVVDEAVEYLRGEGLGAAAGKHAKHATNQCGHAGTRRNICIMHPCNIVQL